MHDTIVTISVHFWGDNQGLKSFQSFVINKNNNPSSAWVCLKKRQPPNCLISQMKGMIFKCMQISTFRIDSPQQHLSFVFSSDHLGVIRASVWRCAFRTSVLIIEKDNKSVLWSKLSGSQIGFKGKGQNEHIQPDADYHDQRKYGKMR